MDKTILERSKTGARLLLLLQFSSRLATFTLNQLLYRLTDPALLGLAYVQLDLVLSTLLFVSREGLRCAALRQPLLLDASPTEKSRRRTARLVNTAYLPFLFASVLMALGLFLLPPSYLSGPTDLGPRVAFPTALRAYLFAVLLELLVEPAYTLAQVRMDYTVRIRAEGTAVAVRSITTLIAVLLPGYYPATSPFLHGLLPFAWAQIAHSLTLHAIYLADALHRGQSASLVPGQEGLLQLDRPLLALAWTMSRQSLIKHLLTEGDRLIITAIASPTDLGIYAFVSNYGSLLARLVFNPLEEASKGLFAKLFSPADPAPAPQEVMAEPSTEGKQGKDDLSESKDIAATTLATAVRLHLLLALPLLLIAPSYTHLLISLTGGRAWLATTAPTLLSLYCAYIPFMGINGMLEAFLQSVAPPDSLSAYNYVMILFTAIYLAVGTLLMSFYHLGAYGLILANILNMSCRILWCWSFARSFLAPSPLALLPLLPSSRTLGVAFIASATIALSNQLVYGTALTSAVAHVAIGGVATLLLLFTIHLTDGPEIIRVLRPLTRGKTE